MQIDLNAANQVFTVNSVDELVQLGVAFGAQIAPLLQTKNLAIELVGDVGAGKTTFVQGVARGLGFQGEVTSPSFTICKKYNLGNTQLSHYDFYRLPDPGIMSSEIAEALTEPGSLVIVEWGASVSELLPEDHFVITIRPLEPKGRQVTISHAK